MHKDDEGRRKVTENFTSLVPRHDGKGKKGTKSEVPRQYNSTVMLMAGGVLSAHIQ